MSEKERKLLNSIYYRLDDETELSKEESNLLLKFIKMNDKEIKRLHSIIKEVREFIYKCNDGKQGINYSGCSKLLEILDKEVN